MGMVGVTINTGGGVGVLAIDAGAGGGAAIIVDAGAGAGGGGVVVVVDGWWMAPLSMLELGGGGHCCRHQW